MNIPEAVWYGSQGPQQLRLLERRPLGSPERAPLNDRCRTMVCRKTAHLDEFCAFPALGYWEIAGRPVSSAEAQSGRHPDAIWVRINHSECCLKASKK